MTKAESPLEPDEVKYLEYLARERHLYAWCLMTLGGYTRERADTDAAAFYVYEPPHAPHRGLVFHDLSWHWAMLALHGSLYWRTRPELENPSEAYWKEAARPGSV